MTIKIQGDKITFPDDSEQTTAYDGSSGGIPEAPVDGKQYGRQDAEWTEVTGGGTTEIIPVLMSGRVNQDGTNQAGFGFEASKAADGTYTVNFDTPLDEGYVVSVNSATGLVANVFGETFTQFKVQLYDINGAVSTQTWQFSLISLETKAVGGGSGGKTVAFRGELSANQTVTTKVWAKINLNTASVDTDSALVDGKFQPSVAGYYQVNGSIAQSCTPASVQTIARLNKNGDSLALGNQVASSVSCTRSSVSDVVYLNGTTDYLEIYGYVDSSGTCAINDSVQATFLSAVLVSGGSGETTRLYEEVYPTNISGVVSTGFTPLTGTLTADVVAGKKYLITGGANGAINNVENTNTYAYWKLATVLNGGTAEDTLCNMVIGAARTLGGTGMNSPMERSFTYTAPESGTLSITAYVKVAGSGANGAFSNNVVRMQEVG